MYGLEVERVIVDSNEQYITPFVGKDKPWWDGLYNTNRFTNEKMKMVATVINDRAITVEDIRIHTNVDNILVEKKPYWLQINNNPVISTESFYLIRPDTLDIVNNYVTNVYTPIQHSFSLIKAEELRNRFCNLLSYYSAGVLFGGKIFWVQLEQEEGYVTDEDKLLLTLMFLSNHTGANSLYTTITRVVCNNTLLNSLSNVKQQYLITHKGAIEANYNNLLAAFDADSMMFQQNIELYRYWSNLDLRNSEIVDLIRFSLGLEDNDSYEDNYQFKEAMRLLEEQKGVELMRGKYTAYRVFNALTELTHFMRGNRIYNSLFGKVNGIVDRFVRAVKKN